MSLHPDAARLVRGLKAALRQAKISHSAASQHLDRGPSYVSRVFGGRLKLKVREVFELIELAGFHPWKFFDVYFPLGGERYAALRERYREERADYLAKAPDTGALLLARLQRDLRHPVDSTEWSNRAGALLREKILAAGRNQRAISRELGLSPVALGLALRGNSRLTFGHVFGVLDRLGMSPARFFVELMSNEEDPTERLRLAEILDEFERTFEGALSAIPVPPPKAALEAERKGGAPLAPGKAGSDEGGNGEGG